MDQLLSRALVGRAQELTAVQGAVDAAASGRGEALALVGEAGIGKSRLRREAERRAQDRGLLVLSGRAVEAVAPGPFRPLTEALAGAFRAGGPPRDASLLPLLPTLAHLVPGWWDRPTPQVSVAAIAEATLRLLEVVGRDRGALLVVEDAHWADADSLAVVEYLADNAAAHGAAILLTLRPQPGGAALGVVRRLADRRAAATVELAPLAPAEVDQLVLSCLDQEAASAELFAFVRARADGVPFYVEELLAGLVRAGGLVHGEDGWRLVGHRLTSTVPATLADSVARRFQELPARSRGVLGLAALLGRDFDWRLLSRVTGLAEAEVLTSLAEAAAAQLLEGDGEAVRFRHALTRDHVIALILAPERARLAAAAVRALEAAHPGLTGGWRELAAELAELAGDHGRAARHLLVAADQAEARGALATAAARLEQAQALARTEPQVALAARERLARVRALAGDVDSALELGTQALRTRRARGDDPGREVDLELTLARATLAAGRCGQARAHVDRAAWRAADLEDRQLLARAAALAAQVALEGGDVDGAARLADKALAGAGDDLPEVRCEALEVTGRCARLHDLGAAQRAFEAALAVAEAHGLSVWRARALHELGTIDLLETMRVDRLQAARRAAVEAGAPATAAIVDFHLASALVARGQVAAGRAVAERAVTLARRLRLAILPFALVVLARTYAQERRPEPMEAALERARAASGNDPAVQAAAWGYARAMLALHQADRDGARAALDHATELLRRCPDQHFPYWGLWALLRTLADDDGPKAREEAARAAGSDTSFNRALLQAADGVAAGHRGDPARAAQAVEEAVAVVRGYEDGDWLVHLLGWLLAPAALADSWGQPVARLQEAVRWFGAHGNEALASACRLLLRDADAPVPRQGRGTSPVPDALVERGVTSREMDVLWLVAERLTNRQIAERLVLSPKTVEKHVASLLRKTGAPGRSALSDLAGQPP